MINKALALRHHSGFIRYFKNSAWMLSEQILRIISGLLVGIWVARYLGPEQFGILSYVIAFTSIFASLAKLGLDGIIVRELVNFPEKKAIYLGTAFWLKLIGGLLTITLTIIIIPWTANDNTTNRYILILTVGLVFQSFEIVDFYFQSQVLAKFISICKVTQLALSSMTKIYLVITGANLEWFIWITLFDQIFLAISLVYAYNHQNITNLPLRYFEFSIAKKLLHDSWPLVLSSIVIMIYMRIDQLMIKVMLGEYEVGIYSAAVRLSEAWYFIPMLLTTSLFPAIIEAKKVSEAYYYKCLQQLYNLMTWMAISLALLMTFLSKWLVGFLYGEAYQAAGNVLMINIWASVFVFLGVASGKWLLIENLQTLAFWRTFYGMIINLLLNIILIKKYGIIGAAMATLASQCVAAYLFDFFNQKTKLSFIMKSKSLLLFRWNHVSHNI